MTDLERNESGVAGDAVLSEVSVSTRDLSGGAELVAESHPVAVYLASLSSGSRRTMRASLDTIAGFISGGRLDAMSLGWHRIGYQHVAAVRSALAEVYAPSTANKMLSALRGVMKECFRLGYISSEELARACDVEAVKGERSRRGRALSGGELADVLHGCAVDSNRRRGLRDYSIISLMYTCGLRRSEVVSLDTRDYSCREQEIRVRAGKGNKERIIPLNEHAAEALESWVQLIPCSHSEERIELPLFPPVSKSGDVQSRRMTDQGILYVLQRRARECGVESFTPHDLRRTFIGDLLEAGADISTVQQMAGHSNVQTTTRYDRRGGEAKRRAAAMLNLPGREREE